MPLAARVCDEALQTLGTDVSPGRALTTFSLVSSFRPELGICSGLDQQQEQPLAHLEGLHEGPEENADGVTLPEEFDESGGTEETEKAQVDEVILRRRGRKVTIHPPCGP